MSYWAEQTEKKEKARLERVALIISNHSPLVISSRVVACQDEDCCFEGTMAKHTLHVAALVIEDIERENDGD